MKEVRYVKYKHKIQQLNFTLCCNLKNVDANMRVIGENSFVKSFNETIVFLFITEYFLLIRDKLRSTRK